MTYRIRNVVLAVALAALAAMLTSFYVANYKRSVQAAEEGVTVYVASQDIAAGTPGAQVISGSLLEEREVEKRNVIPGAIASPDQIRELVAVQPVYAGEQVSTRRFATQAERGVRAQLTGNQRAVQLAGDPNQVLAGTLKAGDRVDVVGTWLLPESGQRHVSRVVLRDLLVLKVGAGSDVESKLAADGGSHSVQLALTDSQASKLFWVSQNGKWTLQLRPPTDAEDSAEAIETDQSLAFDGLREAQREHLTLTLKEGS
jgi:pilus assembly protein CpaB